MILDYKNSAYRNFSSMGTRMDLVFPETENELADMLYLEIKNECNRIENALSIYIQNSLFSRINLSAGKSFLPLEKEWYDLFKTLIEANRLTRGYFDFTLGAFNPDPSLAHWKKYPALKGLEYLEIDNSGMGIRIKNPGMIIDSGSFGKGYALDCIREILLKYGIKNAFISFGESSILCLGKHPAGNSWKVGIVDVLKGDRTIFTFSARDSSISISGNSPNNRRKYPEGHIVNPFTGVTISELFTCAVIGDGSMISEVLSTAVSACPGEEIPDILANFEDYRLIKIRYSDNEEPEIKQYNFLDEQ